MKYPYFLFALVILSPSAGWAGPEKNLFNLAEEPKSPRFEIKDKTWPKEVGEAEICLWHEDKLAALSFGVDDNFGNEIAWWKEQAQRYDFKVTWFVITGRIGSNSQTGTWEQFRELEQLGHGVESHTVTHLHIEDPGWGGPEWDFAKARAAKSETLPPADQIPSGVEWEYREANAQIEANIPGKKVSAVAYPGGKHTKLNDRKIAAKIYRVGRGAGGRSNPVNMTDYLSTNGMSNWHFGEGSTGWNNVRNILDRNLYRGMQYRGWAMIFAHGVSANPELFTRTFAFLEENRKDLWIGLYTEVAKYGQERDTAELKVVASTPEQITLLVEDHMDDSYFDFPLTIKVRVPDDWKTAQAVQSEKSIPANLIKHEGASYALIQAVPDAGLVSLSPKS